MKKEMEEHLDRMWDRGLANCAELEKKMGIEQADEYILNLILTEDPQEDHYSGTGLEERASRYSQETFAIIKALEEIAQSSQPSICVKWEQEKINGSKFVMRKYSVDMSHNEMIQRLTWITSEEYGDDINLWKKWVEFRKENGFMGTR